MLAFIGAAGIIVYAAWFLLEKRSEQKRAILYQNALHSYSERFRAGVRRKEVEDYLRAQNTPFRQMCCVQDNKKWILDDLTRIGHEPAPWYCSENNIYIAFQFRGPEGYPAGPIQSGPKAEDSDTLTRVTLFPWLEGCL